MLSFNAATLSLCADKIKWNACSSKIDKHSILESASYLTIKIKVDCSKNTVKLLDG